MAKKSQEQLEEMSVDELRREAQKHGIGSTSTMRKSELIQALRGEAGSKAQAEHEEYLTHPRKNEKVVNSVNEHEDYPGQTLVTRNHDVIRKWAEERGAVPATVPGTEHGDRLGVLLFDFPGFGGEKLEHVSWDAWFRTFDERKLLFVYQEHTRDGKPSNFFRLDSPEREDA